MLGLLKRPPLSSAGRPRIRSAADGTGRSRPVLYFSGAIVTPSRARHYIGRRPRSSPVAVGRGCWEGMVLNVPGLLAAPSLRRMSHGQDVPASAKLRQRVGAGENRVGPRIEERAAQPPAKRPGEGRLAQFTNDLCPFYPRGKRKTVGWWVLILGRTCPNDREVGAEPADGRMPAPSGWVPFADKTRATAVRKEKPDDGGSDRRGHSSFRSEIGALRGSTIA